MKRLVVFLAFALAAAFGQNQHFPTEFLKASNFYTSGNDGCAQILAATGQSVSNGFGQSVVVDPLCWHIQVREPN